MALAWARADGKITAPLAAATSTAQLDQLFAAAALELPPEQVAALDEASATFARPAAPPANLPPRLDPPPSSRTVLPAGGGATAPE